MRGKKARALRRIARESNLDIKQLKKRFMQRGKPTPKGPKLSKRQQRLGKDPVTKFISEASDGNSGQA